MYEAKNCDLDLSVEWFKLLFRKIKLDMEAILIIIEAILTYNGGNIASWGKQPDLANIMWRNFDQSHARI